MCGIVGFFQNNSYSTEYARLTAEKMAARISHRGPDDAGVWLDEQAGIVLAHRRLSILDISPAGHQPMVSISGRYVVVFNGEIYNHLELRSTLEGAGVAEWRGHADTETLLAAFEQWGIEKTLSKVVGMFAIALWDREERSLVLARDRMGEKPLYYGWQGEVFLFGSELKAIKAHPAFRAEIDRAALALFMRYNYIPTPYSIYRGIEKLQPGCMLKLSLRRAGEQPGVIPYWEGRHVVEAGLAKPFQGTAEQAVEELERLLKESVAQQMVAEVPLGAFLSGGVDSSTIVALMQAQSGRSVRTFSVGFNDEQYNEAQYAKSVARHIGTDHTELYITSRDALNVVPYLPRIYDEPFADSSQIPMFLLSKLARKHVTVSLSGDGGDELFSGYNRYVLTNMLWRRLEYIPKGIRRILARALLSVSPPCWDALVEPVSLLLQNGRSMAGFGNKLHKGANVMATGSTVELYRDMISSWAEPTSIVCGATEPATILTDFRQQPVLNGAVERMMALDMLSYLPDDILVKVDRAAMAASLETRVPLLDHRVVEFAWRLPLEYKLRNGVGKWVLRQVLYKYVPRQLIERPKMGFSIPLDAWLREGLREWAEELLSESRLRQEGILNPAPIRKKWVEHLSGRQNWQNQLWGVLMFQAWLEEQRVLI